MACKRVRFRKPFSNWPASIIIIVEYVSSFWHKAPLSPPQTLDAGSPVARYHNINHAPQPYQLNDKPLSAKSILLIRPVPLFLRRRDGRAVECGGLENR